MANATTLNPNVPAWFEIPTTDLDRAQRFYEAILDQPLTRDRCVGGELVLFPCGGPPHSGGALIQMSQSQPSLQGSVVYLSVSDLTPVLERVAGQDGETLLPRTALPNDLGYFAQFRDCEGNRVGLWSPA